MTKKDTTLAIISGIVLLASVYFMYTFLFPSNKPVSDDKGSAQNNSQTITGNFDEETLKKVKTYKDYGAATLDNIGRVNPFGPLN